MQSISRRLSILLVLSAVAAILLVTVFVNLTVSNKFNEYMIDIQNKRYERIVSYFEEAYKREGKWSSDTGVELIHEANMGNYCLTLLDSSKQAVWGMDPDDIKTQIHIGEMSGHDSGVYTTKTFEIKVDGSIVGFVDIGQYSSVLLSEEDLTFKSSINKSIIVSGVLTLMIIISLSLYFSKQFSTPIREVAKMSVRLSQGNFDTVSFKCNIDELEDLRKSVNILAGKLKYQDTLRKRLVSDITHEIRTPLNVLQNNLEAMIDGVVPVSKEGLHYLNEEVIRFGKLINDLNLLKEFESESIILNYETIDLDKLITEMSNDYFKAVENKNITFKYEINTNEKYHIIGDKDKIKQVMINLLSNAIKFNENNGKIVIKLYKDNKHIIVDVIDNGFGIKQEDLPFIFERLYRGDKSRNQIEGNGIGLTIVKNILELHNAMIKVDSKEGLGTTVKLYFSAAPNL